MTFADLLGRASERLEAAGCDSARLDAEVLLARAAGVERSGLYARFRELVPESVRESFDELVSRRVQREPVAYIVGEKEFYSLAFRVNRDVLIPRPETELLVDAVLKRAPSGGRVLDVGTGSGCIAVAIAFHRRDLELSACDVSSAALRVAAANVARHGVAGRVRLSESDLFDGLDPDQRYDVVVSNPPYVADHAKLAAELSREPRSALYAGPTGMDVIERLLPQAHDRLSPGGSTIVEFGSDQEAPVRRCGESAGYRSIEVLHDLAGHPRVVIATLPPGEKADS